MCHAVSDFDLKDQVKKKNRKRWSCFSMAQIYDTYVIPLSLDDDRVINIKFENNTEMTVFSCFRFTCHVLITQLICLKST